MNKISLRKIVKFDADFFKKWWRDSLLISLTSGDYNPITDESIENSTKEMINDKNNVYRMIQFGDTTVGQISLIKKRTSWAIQIVIGEKEYWNKGIAQGAIKQLLEIARQKKIRKIFLEVRLENSIAIHVYKKCGFIEKGQAKHPGTLKMEYVLQGRQSGA